MNDNTVGVADQRLVLQGDVCFATVADWLPVGSTAIHQTKQFLDVDFAAVDRVDSSALALILHWLRQAHAAQVQLRLVAVPQKLYALSKVCQVDSFLDMCVQHYAS